jgi:hypothetical protein
MTKPKECHYCKSEDVAVQREDGKYLCQSHYNAWRDGQGDPFMCAEDI